MNITGLGIVGSIAGAPLALTKGADTERAAQESAAQQGHIKSELKAEQAEGIGQTDGEEHTAQERDADGRRPWELPAGKKPDDADSAADTPLPRAPSNGESGQQLDLLG